MALQVAGAIAERYVHRYGPAARPDLFRQVEALRSAVEVKRNGRGMSDRAFSRPFQSKFVANGMRLFRPRQRGQIPLAKLLRRILEKFDWMFCVQMDRLHQRVAMGVDGKDLMNVIDGNVSGYIVRMERHEGNGFATLDPHHGRMVMAAMADHPCVVVIVPDPASRVTDSPSPGLAALQGLHVDHALFAGDRIPHQAIADSLRHTWEAVGRNARHDGFIGSEGSGLLRCLWRSHGIRISASR
jgi:hypothetical protein